jgi:transposase
MEHFPRARVVFDAFHIMKMAGQALDKVRKDLARQGADLRGGLWALRGNVWTRKGKQQQRRIQLMAAYPALGRAVFLLSPPVQKWTETVQKWNSPQRGV